MSRKHNLTKLLFYFMMDITIERKLNEKADLYYKKKNLQIFRNKLANSDKIDEKTLTAVIHIS